MRAALRASVFAGALAGLLFLGTVGPARAAEPPVIGVHLAELAEVTLTDALPAVDELVRALGRRTGRRVVLDDPTWACESRARCADELRARTAATDVVLVDIFGGPTKLHVIVERATALGAPRRDDAYLPRDRALWSAEVDALAARLFPEPRLALDEPRAPDLGGAAPTPTVTEAPRLRTVLALVAFGTAAVAGGAGVALAASNADARSQLRERVLTGSDYEALSSRAETHGLGADVLLGVAIVAAVSGVLALALFD